VFVAVVFFVETIVTQLIVFALATSVVWAVGGASVLVAGGVAALRVMLEHRAERREIELVHARLSARPVMPPAPVVQLTPTNRQTIEAHRATRKRLPR
jgi:hypothetical protein